MEEGSGRAPPAAISPRMIGRSRNERMTTRDVDIFGIFPHVIVVCIIQTRLLLLLVVCRGSARVGPGERARFFEVNTVRT